MGTWWLKSEYARIAILLNLFIKMWECNSATDKADRFLLEEMRPEMQDQLCKQQ